MLNAFLFSGGVQAVDLGVQQGQSISEQMYMHNAARKIHAASQSLNFET